MERADNGVPPPDLSPLRQRAKVCARAGSDDSAEHSLETPLGRRLTSGQRLGRVYVMLPKPRRPALMMAGALRLNRQEPPFAALHGALDDYAISASPPTLFDFLSPLRHAAIAT